MKLPRNLLAVASLGTVGSLESEIKPFENAVAEIVKMCGVFFCQTKNGAFGCESDVKVGPKIRGKRDLSDLSTILIHQRSDPTSPVLET